MAAAGAGVDKDVDIREELIQKRLCAPLNGMLLARLAPLLPADDLRSIACDALGLQLHQYHGAIFTGNTLNDTVYHCLKIAVKRNGINDVATLRNAFSNASQNNVVSYNCVLVFEQWNIAGDVDDRSLSSLASLLVVHICKEQLQPFFCGFLGLGLEQVKQHFPTSVDRELASYRILAKWKKNTQQNSATDLLDALKRVGYDQQCIEAVELEARKVCGSRDYGNVYGGIIDFDQFENVRDVLKKRYKDYDALNPLPWLSMVDTAVLTDVFVTLYVNREGRKSETISMNDLFAQQGLEEEGPLKILLHGEAGAGKTTLISKIALDWARGKTDIKYLRDFSAVFVIKAGLIANGDTFNQYVKRELLPRRDSWPDLENELCMENVLIMIDGFDERHSSKDFILDVLNRIVFLNSTVLLSSRYGSTRAIRSKFDLIVGLKGFTECDIKHFVDKHADDETKMNFAEISSVEHPLFDTLANPLYLWMFVLLGRDYFKNVSTFTRTGFYEQMLEGITDKAKHKLCTVDQSIDEEDVDRAMERLLLLAFQCTKDDTLQISTVSSVDDVMRKLGLLNTVTSLSGLKENNVYVFAHRTILEYLTARYILSRVDSTNVANQAQYVCKLLYLFKDITERSRRKSSLLLMFVLGMFKSNYTTMKAIIEEFFPTLQSHAQHEYHQLLAVICELEDADQSVINLLASKASSEISITRSCTTHCIRGVGIICSARRLDHVVVHEYPHVPHVPLQANICSISACSGAVTNQLLSKLSRGYVQVLLLESLLVTYSELQKLVQTISECTQLDSLSFDNIKLTGDVERSLDVPASLHTTYRTELRVSNGYDYDDVTSFLLTVFWKGSSQIEVCNVDLDESVIEHLRTSGSVSYPPSILKLKWLHNSGTSRLLQLLGATTDEQQQLCELEVWCKTDRDSHSVAGYVTQNKKLSVFKWRCNEISNKRGQNCIHFVASEQSVYNMWYRIVTEATHLETVLFQEFTDQLFVGGRRDDNVFIDIIKQHLTPEQRSLIRWKELHVIDKNIQRSYSDQLYSELQKLLPCVENIFKMRPVDDAALNGALNVTEVIERWNALDLQQEEFIYEDMCYTEPRSSVKRTSAVRKSKIAKAKRESSMILLSDCSDYAVAPRFVAFHESEVDEYGTLHEDVYGNIRKYE